MEEGGTRLSESPGLGSCVLLLGGPSPGRLWRRAVPWWSLSSRGLSSRQPIGLLALQTSSYRTQRVTSQTVPRGCGQQVALDDLSKQQLWPARLSWAATELMA